MPRHKSAEKRVRQSKRRNVRNRNNKSEAKKLIKAVAAAVKTGTSADETEKALRAAVQKLDRMEVKGLMHRNAVARHKSRLVKSVNATKKTASK
ncbi:MAG: 30S ribosomal protein S20 [Chloroherpetonaceae bacterium]|nr:30S ribosomal protein S20 [Chloroherpetonaceae bacterium]